MKNSVKSQIQAIKTHIEKHLSKERYEHSLSVAKYARHLARIYGKGKKTQRLAYFAGLSHDICKELSDSEQIKLISEAGSNANEVEKQRLNLLHGRTGAYVLQRDFSVTNKKVLKAVKHHTFGSKKLSTVGKLIFLADKIEPRRKGAEKWRYLVGSVSLDALVLKVLQSNISNLRQKGLIVSPLSLEMEAELIKKLRPQ